MSNVGTIFKEDVRHLCKQPIALVVIIGLCVIPSLYAWVNVASGWDPYGNTSGLKIAIANEDEGYENSLLPLTINMGNDVVANLTSDDSFNWVFTDEDSAVEGVRSGDYYAALVIPKEFTRNMLSVFTDDPLHAEVTYYTNEKENAVAPRITDQGVDDIQNLVDETFTSAVTKVAMQTVVNMISLAGNETVHDYANYLLTDVDEAIAVLDEYADQMLGYADLCSQLAVKMDTTSATAQECVGTTAELQEQLSTTIAHMKKVQAYLPAGTKVAKEYAAVIEELQATLDALKAVSATNDKTAEDIARISANTAISLRDTSDKLVALSTKIKSLTETLQASRDKLAADLESADLDAVLDLIGDDTAAFAELLSSPVETVRHEVYPVENNGSFMASFYSILAIWVGSIFMMALMRTDVSDELRKKLKKPHEWQLYLGRYLIFMVVALIQATLIGLGDIFIMGIQCEEPLLFMVTCWVTSIVYSNLIYTLASAFGSIGKGICVILLVMQIGGTGAAFPIEMSAQIFQDIYPFLPFTFGLEAIRACIAGVYGTELVSALVHMCWLLVPSLFIGLVLRGPFVRLNAKTKEKFEKTKMM